MKTLRLPTSIDHVILALFCASLAGNVYLGVKVLRPPSGSPRAQLTAGTEPGAFEAQNLDGSRAVIRPQDVAVNTVIYAFSPQCSWCEKNLDNLRALVTGAGNSYRVIGVSLDPDVADYLRTHRVDFPVLVRPSLGTMTRYHLGGTPQTIVLSPAGKVLRSWQGAYGGNTASDVSDFFAIKLPGLLDGPVR